MCAQKLPVKAQSTTALLYGWMLNLRKQLKQQGCYRENTSTFNVRIKDVAESSTMTARRI